jgi:hypothetical protein
LARKMFPPVESAVAKAAINRSGLGSSMI